MTGLVYAVIIALWGVVLVPMWLRRHEESSGRRSAHRYRRAMETLGRKTHIRRLGHLGMGREALIEDDDVEYEDWGQVETQSTMSVVPIMDTVVATVRALLPHANLARTSIAARRRRRVVMILGVALAASAAGAAVGIVPGFVAVLVFLAMAGFVSALARQTRSAQIAHLAESRQRRDSESQRYRLATAHARHTGRVAAGAGRSTGAVRIVNGEDAWSPVPTTLPTYVTKEKATKVPRVIDLTAPNREWSGQAMVDQAREQAMSTDLGRAEVRARLQEQFDLEMSVLEPAVEDEVAEWARADFGEDEAVGAEYYPRAANQ